MQKKEREERESRASVTAVEERGGFVGLLQWVVGLGKLPLIFFPPNFFSIILLLFIFNYSWLKLET